MRKPWLLATAISLVLAIILIMGLYTRRFIPSLKNTVKDSYPVAQTDVAITETKGRPNIKGLKTATVNKVTVDSVSSNSLQTEDGPLEQVNLTISQSDHGTVSKITIPLIDSIFLHRVSPNNPNNEKVRTPVLQVPWTVGDLINITFAFNSDKRNLSPEEVASMCETSQDVCLPYTKLGFGGTLINFTDYWNSVATSDEKLVDPSILVPQTIMTLD